MKFYRMVLLFATLVEFTSFARALAIKNFYYDGHLGLTADVTWDCRNPGTSATAEMLGEKSPGISWATVNGGIAFLDIIRDASSLRFQTWNTDTNGDYSATAIDIFALPIDISLGFPLELAGSRVHSTHGHWLYRFAKLANNPNGFRIYSTPDSLATATSMGLGLIALYALHWQRRKKTCVFQ